MYFRPTGDLFDCASNVGNVITHGGIIYCSQSREEKLSSRRGGERLDHLDRNGL